jgi:hypothetical protein
VAAYLSAYYRIQQQFRKCLEWVAVQQAASQFQVAGDQFQPAGDQFQPSYSKSWTRGVQSLGFYAAEVM